jgi:hypothetical protein
MALAVKAQKLYLRLRAVVIVSLLPIVPVANPRTLCFDCTSGDS